jgi:3-dehydroquinate synthase class II
MTIRSAVLVSLLTGAVAMGAIACGGGSSTAISGPTSGTSGSSPIATTPSAQANATIMGTVVGGAGAASTGAIHALSALRVSVVGTSISATCDGSGHFTLSSVPTGHVQLHFQGPGVDARLDLDGLQDGETLTITVHVEGSNASIEPEGTGVEIHGMITMLSPLTVDGQSIMTDTDTRVVGADGQPLTLTDLKVGDEVEVNGTQQADGSILAGKIKVESGDEGTKQVEFHGTISALDPLTVAGKTIMTDANTRVVGQEGETLTLADLKVGDEVEVNGTKQADGSVLASRIKVESGAGD